METLAERPTCMLPRQTLQEETVRPLSFPQERMWLLGQIDPGPATYNLFHTVDISGPNLLGNRPRGGRGRLQWRVGRVSASLSRLALVLRPRSSFRVFAAGYEPAAPRRK